MTDHADTEDVRADALDAEEGIIMPPGKLAEARKFIVALIGAVVTILALNGIEVDQDLIAAITTLVTAGLVWVVPNERV
jgi:hypothetical protein